MYMSKRTDQPLAVIYGRISLDAAGEAAGVRRQLADGRALAKRRGFRVVAELSDNDISALSGDYRPAYAEVLELVRQGAVSAVIVWQTSRLWRNRRERVEAVELFAQQGVSVLACRGPELDLSTAYGRALAGLLGEFDTLESEVKAERVARAAQQRAEDGNPNAGLGYGWEKTGKHDYRPHPDQAPIVAEITRRLLRAESLKAIAADLTARGVPASHAKGWGPSSVRKIALRPSNAGIRIHHRGRPTERLYAGTWPALVSREDWQQVTALLTDPARRMTAPERPGARRYLVSYGIGECGVCGARLRVSTRRGTTNRRADQSYYVCDAAGCVGRNQQRLDQLVREVVVGRLSQPDAAGLLAGDSSAIDAALQAITDARTKLDGAAELFAAGQIDAGQLAAVTSRLRPQLDAAEADHRRALAARGAEALADVAGPRAAEAWDGLAVTQQRAILRALGVRVIVKRSAKRGPGFDPDAVHFSPWEDAAEDAEDVAQAS